MWAHLFFNIIITVVIYFGFKNFYTEPAILAVLSAVSVFMLFSWASWIGENIDGGNY